MRRIVLWVVVLVVLFFVCAAFGAFGVSTGAGATEPTVEPALQKTEPAPGYPVKKRFNKDGRRADNLAEALGLRAGSVCWQSPEGLQWKVVQGFYGTMYTWVIDIRWCGRNGRVTNVIWNFCRHGKGYYAYDECHKEKGAFGYDSLGLHYDWKFHFTMPLLQITDSRHPEVRMQVGANGNIWGTVWFDAA